MRATAGSSGTYGGRLKALAYVILKLGDVVAGIEVHHEQVSVTGG